ncbi:MAG: hypothetical protein AAF596_05905 [Planctomycetota bacterium]
MRRHVMQSPAPPRWLPWACAAVMLVGMALLIGGPMLSYALALARVDAELTPEELLDKDVRTAKEQEVFAEHRERDAWMIPVGMGLAGMGTMALLFLFVSRPLGSDLDDDQAANADRAESDADPGGGRAGAGEGSRG